MPKSTRREREGDVPDQLARLRDGRHWEALVTFPSDEARHNLEAALSDCCELDTLAAGMQLIAETRGYDWSDQQADLLSRLEGATPEQREAAKATSSVPDLLAALPEPLARTLVRRALGGGGITPFEIKGARPARLLAETIVDRTGVPPMFRSAMLALDAWSRRSTAVRVSSLTVQSAEQCCSRQRRDATAATQRGCRVNGGVVRSGGEPARYGRKVHRVGS